MTGFRIWVWWSAHPGNAGYAFLPARPGKTSSSPLHILPRISSGLRGTTGSSVLRYDLCSSDLPQAVAYGGAIMPCVYTLHRVDIQERSHVYLFRIL